MDAKVCASAASLATAATPADAAAIAARTVPGCPGRTAPLRHALVAIVCVLGLHRPCLPGLPPRRSIPPTRCASLRPQARGSRRSGRGDIRHGRASGRAGHHQFHPLADDTRAPASVRHGPARPCARPDRYAAGRLDAARRAACALRRSRARHRLRHRLSRQPGRRGTRARGGSGGRPSGADNFGKRSILHRGRHVLSQRRRRARVVRHQSRRGRTQWRARASERAQSRATAGAP